MPTDWEIGYAIQAPYGDAPHVSPISRLKDDPFIPNDIMDWAFGLAFVGIPYIIAFSRGGFPAVGAYSAAAPDLPMFASGVATSNFIQEVAFVPGPRDRRTFSPTVTSGFMMV